MTVCPAVGLTVCPAVGTVLLCEGAGTSAAAGL